MRHGFVAARLGGLVSDDVKYRMLDFGWSKHFKKARVFPTSQEAEYNIRHLLSTCYQVREI